jgi:phosphatidate cytidylyltransferase
MVYAFMALSSAVGFAFSKPIRQAINSWWPPALVAGAVVVSGAWVGIVVFAVISLWALYEYHRMLDPDVRNKRIELLVYCSAPLHYFLLITTRVPFATGLAAWTFGILPLAWLFFVGTRGALSDIPKFQWGIVLTTAALSHVPRLLMLAAGHGLAAFLFVTVMFNDAAQYVFGKLFGRTPLAPSISPKKTWEGFVGGALTSTVIAMFVGPLVTPFDITQSALIGFLLSVLGLLGDLTISGIKRDAGVKDTGAVLPQHGGILDRCDSLLLAAPLFFYGVRAWVG